MEALVLIGGCLSIGVLGFWIMGRIDRFIDRGGFSPDWDGPEGTPPAPSKPGGARRHGPAIQNGHRPN